MLGQIGNACGAYKVPQKLLIDMKNARILAKSILGDISFDTMSWSKYQKLFKEVASDVSSADSSFAVEAQLVEHSADTAFTAVVRARSLAALPTASTHRTLADSLLKMQAMQRSAIFKIAPLTSRMEVTGLEQVLLKLERDIAPEPASMKGDYFGEAMSMLQYFCAFEAADTAPGSTRIKTTFGKPAMDAHVLKMEETMKDDEKSKKVVYGDLDVFHRFGWLLEPENSIKLAEWVKKAMSNTKADVVTKDKSKGASSSSSSAAKRINKQKGTRIKKEATGSNIMSFFGM